MTATSLLSPGELNIDPVSGMVTLLPSSNQKVGTYTATVKVTLTNYPTQTQSVSFTITVDPCIITSIGTSSTSPIGDKLYYLSDPNMVWSHTASSLITQVPACDYQAEASSTSGLPYF